MNKTHITGVILAGGRATRMGGRDKGLVKLNSKYMIEHVITALRPQVGQLLISANRNLEQYAQLSDCPVLADTFGHYDGPLAGMATALANAQTDYVLFAPCDSPFISSQLAERLYTRLIQTNADASVADDGSRIHPVFSLLKRSLLADLMAFLKTEERSIRRFLAQLPLLTKADFSDNAETFLNINTFEERDNCEYALKKESL
ncbi:molybdenum cofactor guanylyltransferase MobA [Candidatus Marithioploca araucensis]|uniref:Molybdenum cofactor guanylyltransferase n=1 Tax=Candidatus Marithioploca araucensis TaxID=70273 RepID=A0ABT7VQL7_9GAMM|nr:molybdenum cofactor guanylyltransferase MobA [Candidatus Marithioploca araucensis]